MTPAGWALHASQRTWTLANHLAVVHRHILALIGRRFRYLMVLMPPRHGKSTLISQYLPSWYLGTFPRDRVMLASYEHDFAASWGQKARDAMDAYGQSIFGLRVRQDTRAASGWDLVRYSPRTGRGNPWLPTGGGMTTAGVGGAITGRGANVLIMDDPIKNFEEANSRTYRQRLWDWWRSTALPRLEPDGVAVLMQTRWHEDDLAGRIIEQSRQLGETWIVLRLPAIATEPESWPTGWQRQPGEPLWPGRYPLARLKEIQAEQGPYWWEALYQQAPTVAEGNIFKRVWFRYYSVERQGDDTIYILHTPAGDKYVPKSKCWIFQTCDPAASEDEQADYFTLATWAITPENELLLLDMYRDHAATVRHEAILRQQSSLWQPSYQGVEDKTFGLNIIQGAVKSGLPIKALPAEGDKVARSKSVSARYALGAVYHPRGAPWLDTYEQELLAFPTGRYDDQVDVAAYAGIELIHASQFGRGYGIE